MIRPNELQIGDWVHEKYESLYGSNDEYVQVDGILAQECANQHGGNGTIWGKGHGNLGGGDCLYPIPLTAEILEKNNTTRDEYADKYNVRQYWFSDVEGFQSVSVEWEGSKIFLGIRSETRVYSGSICFVHQLQQALRLCGLTELANNIKL